MKILLNLCSLVKISYDDGLCIIEVVDFLSPKCILPTCATEANLKRNEDENRTVVRPTVKIGQSINR